MGFIYKITNTINNKIYIGKTTRTVEKRYKDHLYSSKKSNCYLHIAMRKYGVENHLQHIHYTGNAKAYLQSLLGRVSFVLQTEANDEDFLEYKTYLTNVLHQI